MPYKNVITYVCRHTIDGFTDGDYSREYELHHMDAKMVFIFCDECHYWLRKWQSSFPGIDDSEIIINQEWYEKNE